MHQLKSWAMLRVFDHIAPEADKVFLFDADALVVARWPYFEALVEAGVALVLDHWFPRVAWTHPVAARLGGTVPRSGVSGLLAFCNRRS